MGQLAFREPLTWGGRRKGAGRKRRGRPGVAHGVRPAYCGRNPLHVTFRRAEGLVSLRRRDVFGAVRGALVAGSRAGFNVVEYSVQNSHIHLIIESGNRDALMRGAKGLAIRLARAINRVLRRRGQVWGDRYHVHELRTPREVRNALRYVLLNVRKHLPHAWGIDPCSSGAWFDGWAGAAPATDRALPNAGTWLLSIGWRRHGLLSL
jgi:REP-associated tyrosine transposase